MHRGHEDVAPDRLGDEIPGGVVLPDEDGWDGARQAWNLAVDLRPVAVAFPESPADVQACVRSATAHGLRVAFLGGGHNAGPIDWSSRTMLLRTERLRAISVDPASARATIGAGVLAHDLARAAGQHGLCFLAGTSPDTGVVGYTLGGGLSWMARRFGLAAHDIIAVELVTADGRILRIDADREPDLFWAIRGGGGSFGAVTALELMLHRISEIHAGGLFWPIDRAREVLHAWRRWTDDVPDACQSIGRLLQLPDAPFLPDHLRGRSFVIVEAAILAAAKGAGVMLAPLRALGPEIDTFATMRPQDLPSVNMDPTAPVAYRGDGGTLFDELPPAAIDQLVETFVGSPLLHAELRHLGGALRVPDPSHGCLGAFTESFLLFTFGLISPGLPTDLIELHVERVLAGLAPWASSRRYLNFTESSVDPAAFYPAAAYERLRSIRARVDPQAVFAANHSIPAADSIRSGPGSVSPSR